MDSDLKAILCVLGCFISYPPVNEQSTLHLLACVGGCWATWHSGQKKDKG